MTVQTIIDVWDYRRFSNVVTEVLTEVATDAGIVLVFQPLPHLLEINLDGDVNGESRPQESAQDDKWSFCLTAGTLCPANQEMQ